MINRRRFLRIGCGALGAVSLGGCESDPIINGGRGFPRLSVRPSLPTMGVALGETALGLGTDRDGVLYVPQSYDPEVPMPLVVAMHGTPGGASLWTPFQEACEARGMIMLAIESRGLAWDLIETGSFGVDLPFIDEALAFTFDRCRIDTTRVCMMGFSDGASYAITLGTSNGDLFTHLISFSPGFWFPVQPLVGNPGIFVSHGREDEILPYATTRDGIVPQLESLGYDVTFETFDGPHIVPREIGQAAFDWFGAPA
ncbi:MAG: phospholipase [Gemmatimonadota bacterium]